MPLVTGLLHLHVVCMWVWIDTSRLQFCKQRSLHVC